MAKKAKRGPKKAEKEEEEEVLDAPEEKEVKTTKTKKVEKKPAFDLTDIFSETFRGKLGQYISLNSEVLTLKGEAEGSDQTEEINGRKESMAKKVEGTASTILEDELKTLENWIEDEQAKLKAKINQVGQAFTESKDSLVSTGFFSEGDV